jgi:hypothetical protein
MGLKKTKSEIILGVAFWLFVMSATIGMVFIFIYINLTFLDKMDLLPLWTFNFLLVVGNVFFASLLVAMVVGANELCNSSDTLNVNPILDDERIKRHGNIIKLKEK